MIGRIGMGGNVIGGIGMGRNMIDWTGMCVSSFSFCIPIAKTKIIVKVRPCLIFISWPLSAWTVFQGL